MTEPLAVRIANIAEKMLIDEDDKDTTILLLASTQGVPDGIINSSMLVKGTSRNLAELLRNAKRDETVGTAIKAIILSNTFS